MNCIRKPKSKEAHYKIRSHALASTAFNMSSLKISQYFVLAFRVSEMDSNIARGNLKQARNQQV
jgi:hypothetical protein